MSQPIENEAQHNEAIQGSSSCDSPQPAASLPESLKDTKYYSFPQSSELDQQETENTLNQNQALQPKSEKTFEPAEFQSQLKEKENESNETKENRKIKIGLKRQASIQEGLPPTTKQKRKSIVLNIKSAEGSSYIEESQIQSSQSIKLHKKKSACSREQLFTSLDSEIVCIDDGEMDLIMLFNRKIQQKGKMIVTNYRLLFIKANDQGACTKTLFQMPLGFIYVCERKVEPSTGCSFIQITTRNGLVSKFRYIEFKSQKSHKSFSIFSKLIQTTMFFSLEYGSLIGKPFKLENPMEMFNAQGSDIYENEGWKLLPQYPEYFRVPVPYVGKTSTSDRLVLLSYVQKGDNGATIWRNGPGRAQPQEEQWVPKAVNNKTMKHFVIDIKNKPLGNARSLASEVIELENMTALRQSYAKLSKSSVQTDKWVSLLNASKWFDQIGALLTQATKIAQKINNFKHITILADTEVRGAQLSSLIQILLDPMYRTLQGFPKLLQKEFLNIGHTKVHKKQKQEDKGIAIIQFLDCIHQLTFSFPLSFEFTIEYLRFIAYHVYSSRFGNFLFATKTIQAKNRKKLEKCYSIWLEIQNMLASEQGKAFQNPFYVDEKRGGLVQLFPTSVNKNLRFWHDHFDLICQGKGCSPLNKIYEIYSRVKEQNMKVRKLVSEQQQEIQNKKETLQKLKEKQKELRYQVC